jgi:hypothetical protein
VVMLVAGTGDLYLTSDREPRIDPGHDGVR